MAHTVKCAICGETFDRDKIQAVRHGARRYAHVECYPEGELIELAKTDVEKEQKAKDLTSLKNYINKLFGDECNWSRTIEYIKKFSSENNFTYTGMEKALKYFYEIKKNPLDKANGSIGIIPYIYDEAKKYFLEIYLAQQEQQKNIEIYNKEIKTQEVTISIKKSKRQKLFNL